MLEVERDFVEPLFRPPLSLSVVAAAFKYVATVVVLTDPLLSTSSEYVQKRQADDNTAQKNRCVQLACRLAFVFLAGCTLMHDLRALTGGFPERSWWDCCHLFATVLAFSPNTVAAVASLFIMEVHIGWLTNSLSLHSSSTGKASDIVAIVYCNLMACTYVLPLMVVSFTNGIIGGFTTAYAIMRDLTTLPMRLYDGNFNAIWIAIPVCVALIVKSLLEAGIVLGQTLAFERWHPELAQRIRDEGTRVNSLKVKMPQAVPANVIGRARELVSPENHIELPDVVDTTQTNQDLLQEAGEVHENGEKEKTEQCILNDPMLAWICYMKVSLCLSLPFIQLAVVIAARLFSGEGMMAAAQNTFAERSWAHYFDHLKDVGAGGILKLFWYYI